jgi:hypothetical protein
MDCGSAPFDAAISRPPGSPTDFVGRDRVAGQPGAVRQGAGSVVRAGDPSQKMNASAAQEAVGEVRPQPCA